MVDEGLFAEEFPHFCGSLLSLSDVAEAVGFPDRLKTKD